MNNNRLSKAGHLLALFLILILLFMARGFLATRPLLSGSSFLFFSILYLIATLVSRENYFLYPVMFFGALSYYLFLYFFGVSPPAFPAFSLLLVFILLLAAYLLERGDKKIYATPLEKGMAVTVLIFTLWIVRGGYFTSWVAVPLITFLGYALLYYLRNKFSRRRGALYLSLFYFSAFYLFLLYGIKYIASGYYGFFLLALAALWLFAGTVLHRSKGIGHSLPFYVISFLIVFLSFFYSGREPSLLLASLVITSLVYRLALNRVRSPGKLREPTFSERVVDKVILVIADLPAYLCLALLVYYKFALTLTNMVIALVYFLLYLVIARQSKITFLRIRNHYLYLSGIFLIIFYFLLLFSLRPLADLQLRLMFSLPLLFAILIFAHSLDKRGEVILSGSARDLGYLMMAVVFILSFLSRDYSPAKAAILSGLFLIAYLIFMRTCRGADFIFALTIIGSYGYYNLLIGLGTKLQNLGVFFLFPGLALILAGYLLQRRGIPLAKVFYIASLLVAFVSIYLSRHFPERYILSLSVWALSYLLIAQAMVSKRRRAET